tara:strand:+ start:133 stop:294 length:162 start_codon:yes stop_codon:yes gene_type:complete
MSKTNIIKCGGCGCEISVTDERYFFWIGGDENPCCGHEPCAIKTGHREIDVNI